MSSPSVFGNFMASKLNTAFLSSREGIFLSGEIGGSLLGLFLSLFFSNPIFGALLTSAFWVGLLGSGILLILNLINVHHTITTTFPIVSNIEMGYTLVLSLWLLVASVASVLTFSLTLLAGFLTLFFFVSDFYFRFKAFRAAATQSQPPSTMKEAETSPA